MRNILMAVFGIEEGQVKEEGHLEGMLNGVHKPAKHEHDGSNRKKWNLHAHFCWNTCY